MRRWLLLSLASGLAAASAQAAEPAGPAKSSTTPSGTPSSVPPRASDSALPGKPEAGPASPPSPVPGPVAPGSPATPDGPASAEEPPSAAPLEPPQAEHTREPRTRNRAPALTAEADPSPPARDTVGGHVGIGAIGGLLVPFGSIDSRTNQSDVFETGYALGGDVTYGVSRTLVLGLAVQVGFLGGTGDLDATDVSTLVVGPLVRYHLVQGTRFDPWMSFGVAYRSTKTETATLTGIDWARIQLGGDWYAGSQLGFGPVLELSLGTFTSSTDELADGAVNAHFLLGGRLVFDTPGK